MLEAGSWSVRKVMLGSIGGGPFGHNSQAATPSATMTPMSASGFGPRRDGAGAAASVAGGATGPVAPGA